MNVAQFLGRGAVLWPERVALAAGPQTVDTFSSLFAGTSRRAYALKGLGLAAGDRVRLALSRTSPRYLQAMYAVWHAGMVAVTSATDATAVLDESAWEYIDRPGHDITGVAAGAEFACVVQNEDGQSVGLTHANILAGGMAHLSDLEGAELGNPWVHYDARATWAMGISRILRGVPQVLAPDPEAPWEGLHCHPGATLFLPQHLVDRLVEAPPAPSLLSTIRSVVCKAPLFSHTLNKALDVLGGHRILQLYGKPECPFISFIPREVHANSDFPYRQERLTSVGLPFCNIQVKADSDTMEIWVRGPGVAQRYGDGSSLTADGWVATGDMGSVDHNGFVVVKGPKREVVSMGSGRWLHPRQVEEVLLHHPSIEDAAVFPHRGEVIGVVVGGGKEYFSEEELKSLCSAMLPPHKRPTRFLHVPSIPRLPDGRVAISQLHL